MWWGLPALLVLLVVYYVGGAVLLTRIDTDLAFRPSPVDLPPRGSVAVAMTSGLLDREVNRYGWKPNNPIIYPTALMDNMPNFQKGILTTERAFLIELRDHVGRLRGTGATDQNLEDAFGALSYPPDIWLIGDRFPFIGVSSESRYRDAIEALREYNQRVASGDALYERRVDNLYAAMNRLALSLGNASAMLEREITDSSGGLLDTTADDVFYDVRGQAYAAHLILSGLNEDYADLIRQRQLTNLWLAMMENLQLLVQIDPLIVSNSDPSGLIGANHLASQGLYLQTVRQRMREITNVIQQ
jgi:hypothetical protein